MTRNVNTAFANAIAGHNPAQKTTFRRTYASLVSRLRGAALAWLLGMTSDDQDVPGEHVVEIPSELPGQRAARRRSFRTISVAVCLGLAGVVTAVVLLRDQSARATNERRDAVQRQRLLDGWTTLGAVAAQRTAQEARAATTPTPTGSTPTATPGAVQRVLVFGSPAAEAAPRPLQQAPVPAPTSVSAPARVGSPTPLPSAATSAAADSPRVAVPAAPARAPLTPAPGSPDTVLSPITYPASQACGLTTCNVDSVCCNVSCGICTAPGESCVQKQCG